VTAKAPGSPQGAPEPVSDVPALLRAIRGELRRFNRTAQRLVALIDRALPKDPGA
jgi:hypothetical protein